MLEDKLPPYNPDPSYLRGLIDKIGLSQRKIADILQIKDSMFRKYITSPDNKSYQKVSYKLQLALEYMALMSNNKQNLTN